LLALILAAALQWPLSTPQVVPSPATPREAVDSFIELFITDDLGAVRGLFAAESGDPSQPLDFLDHYDCFSVRRSSVELRQIDAEHAFAIVSLDATGQTLGKPPVTEILPELWELELVREENAWRIVTAAPRERRISFAFLAAPNDAERRCILDLANDADLNRILNYVSFDGADMGRDPGVAQSVALAQTLADEWNDVRLETAVLRRRALMAHRAGDVPAGLEFSREAARLSHEIGDPGAIGDAHFSLAVAHWFNGDYKEAARSFEAAGALLDQSPDPRLALKALYMSALMLERANNLRGGIARKLQALRAAEEYDSLDVLCASSVSLAESWRDLGHYDLAQTYALRAYRTALNIGQLVHAKFALWSMANTLWATGRKREAAKLMRFVIDHEAPAGGAQEMANQFSALLLELGEPEEAAQVLNRIDPTNDDSRYSIFIGQSRIALAQHRYEDAVALADQAYAQALKPSAASPELSAPAIFKGQALLALGRTDEAFYSFRDAVEWIEDVREETPSDAMARATYFVERLQAYEALVSLSVARGDARQALAFAEKKRGRVLDDVMRRGLVNDSDVLTAAEQEKEAELTTKLVEANRALMANSDRGVRKQLEQDRLAARLALFEYRAQVESAHPNLQARRGTSADVLEHPRALLPNERAAIVLYDVQPENTFAFVITRTGDRLDIATKKIAKSQKSLQSAIEQLARAIRRRDLGWSRRSRAVHDLVVRPIEANLSGRRELIVIPDGPLWNVPFHALQRPSGELLVENTTISYAPSLTALTREPSRERKNDSLLAVGDPAIAPRALVALGGDAAFARLPDAAAEVAEIANFYPDDAFESLIGKRATESAFKEKAANYRVLHFATHGILDRSPLHSALLLSGSETDDGLLEAREIIDLPLTADLTVLSACDTGGGTFTPGEGIMGLSWAFMVAGCPTTVASHWQVGSSSTRQLMTHFYRALREQHLRPAAALRRAQLAMLGQKQYRHPLYWAGFVSIGAP